MICSLPCRHGDWVRHEDFRNDFRLRLVRGFHAWIARLHYEIKVEGDTNSGTESVRSYDANETLTYGPTNPTPIEGKRVTLP